MPRIRRSQRVILRAQDDEDACDEEDDNEEKEKDGEEKEKAENTTTTIVRPHFNLIWGGHPHNARKWAEVRCRASNDAHAAHLPPPTVA